MLILVLTLPAHAAGGVEDRREQTAFGRYADTLGKKDDKAVAKSKLRDVFEQLKNNNTPLSRALGENDLKR